MHIIIDKSALLPILAQCGGVADKRSTLPVLANILLHANGKLSCSATDLLQSVSGEVPADIREQGSIAVDARGIFDRVKMMPDGPITISTKGAQMTLKSGSRRFTVAGVPGEEFPALPTKPTALLLTLDAAELVKLIKSVEFAVSRDESRLHLNSMLLEHSDGQLRVVATDGHRMSVTEAPAPAGSPAFTVLIPLKGLIELRRLCEEAKDKPVQLSQEGPNLFVSVSGYELSARLSDSAFVPWREVLPKECKRNVVVSRAGLADALRAVAISASDRTSAVKLSLSTHRLTVSAETPDAGEGHDELAVVYEGDDIEIGCNAKYLLEALGPLTCEAVSLGLSDELDPILVEPVGDSDWTMKSVVMPCRC